LKKIKKNISSGEASVKGHLRTSVRRVAEAPLFKTERKIK